MPEGSDRKQGEGSLPIRTEPCGVFSVKSGGPMIGLGLLMIIMGVLPWLLGQMSPYLLAFFCGVGLFFCWLGFAR